MGVVDNVSYIQGSTQALVIIHCPYVSTAPLREGGREGVLVFRGAHRPTCSAAMYLVFLGLAWAEGMGAFHISILGLYYVVPLGEICRSHYSATY